MVQTTNCSHDAAQPPEAFDDSRQDRRRSGRRRPSVVDQPTETRSEWSASTPIASSTGDGSSISDEHDEPECTATPCWSSASRIGSASTPSTPMQSRWGSEPSGVGVAEALDARHRRRRPSRPARSSARWRAASASTSTSAHAAPNPTHAGDVFDPAAPGPFLRAADDERRDAQAAAHEQRARTLRAAPLVRGHRAQVGAERGERRRACARSPRTRRRGRARRARATRAHTSAAGCTVPTSWLRELHATRAPCRGASPRRPRPRRSGRAGRRGTIVHSTPAPSIASRTHECSTAVVTTWPRPSARAIAPQIAVVRPPRCPTT